MEPWNAFNRELLDAGAFVAGEGLQPSVTATTVSFAHGDQTVTDGPFAETKEQFGGYYVIAVPTWTRRSSGRRRCRGGEPGPSRCDRSSTSRRGDGEPFVKPEVAMEVAEALRRWPREARRVVPP